VTTSKVYQQFRFTYNSQDLVLDVRIQDQVTVPSVKIYIENIFVDPSRYNFTRTANSTTITFADTVPFGALIEVLALSEQTSAVAFRQVPINLENNPFNANSSDFTLGTVRQHYDNLCENLITLEGQINGANNTRDLGNIVPYGLTILQQSAPLTLAGYFLRDPAYNFFESLIYNSREYTKFKNLILDNVTKQELQFETAAEILDRAIENITAGRVDSQPFYWSDMLPSGAVYTQITYTVSNITTNTFDTNQVYDYASANYQGFNVYFQDRILTRGLDYVVSADTPTFTVLFPLAVGDEIVVRELVAAGHAVDAADRAADLEPSPHAAEAAQRLERRLLVDAGETRGHECRERVLGVVAPEHAPLDVAQVTLAVQHRVARVARVAEEVGGPEHRRPPVIARTTRVALVE
jgi:hypothetical protein